ncbi:hypothetical protein M433DRAFT_131123 [Acidomyces richmondensis BFW]|nr:hypothetical protein M433DRAFT_131123 [Acidomyces richmondensis BFW]
MDSHAWRVFVLRTSGGSVAFSVCMRQIYKRRQSSAYASSFDLSYPLNNGIYGFVIAFATFIASTYACTNLTYEYIVIVSGARGGPLANRLERANNTVLLIEAGDDQGSNHNVSVPGYEELFPRDPNIQSDVFVNYYSDLTRATRDEKFVNEVPNGTQYVPVRDGGELPADAKPLRASEWDYIAQITGYYSCSASNTNQYMDKVYEWLITELTDPTILLHDPLIVHLLIGDIMKRRNGGTQNGVQEFIVDSANQGYPLTVRTNYFVTNITCGTSGEILHTIGVEFFCGKYHYRVSPMSGGSGTPGPGTATR